MEIIFKKLNGHPVSTKKFTRHNARPPGNLGLEKIIKKCIAPFQDVSKKYYKKKIHTSSEKRINSSRQRIFWLPPATIKVKIDNFLTRNSAFIFFFHKNEWGERKEASTLTQSIKVTAVQKLYYANVMTSRMLFVFYDDYVSLLIHFRRQRWINSDARINNEFHIFRDFFTDRNPHVYFFFNIFLRPRSSQVWRHVLLILNLLACVNTLILFKQNVWGSHPEQKFYLWAEIVR